VISLKCERIFSVVSGEYSNWNFSFNAVWPWLVPRYIEREKKAESIEPGSAVVAQRCRNTCISEESFAGIFNRTQVDDIKLRSVSYGQEMMEPKIPCELWARNLTLAVYIHSCKLRHRSHLHAMTLCSFLHARTQSYTCMYLGPKSRFSLVILSSCAEIISLVKVYIYAQ
jgi:hypothetical protein